MSPDEVIESKHAMAGLAEILRAYYDSLRTEGFSRRDSMQMVIAYQCKLARNAQSGES